MGDSDADPIVRNIELAESSDWTPDEVSSILGPYDGLYVRAVSLSALSGTLITRRLTRKGCSDSSNSLRAASFLVSSLGT